MDVCQLHPVVILFHVQRKHERSSLFNLNDDEDVLTHYGQAVGQMECFDEVKLSDEEEVEGEV